MDEKVVIDKKVLSGLLEISRIYFIQEKEYMKTYLACKWPDELPGPTKEAHRVSLQDRILAADKLLAEIDRISDQLLVQEVDDEQSIDDRTPDE